METNNEHTARVVGRDLPISTKHAIMIANVIRGKPLKQSQEVLHRVIGKKEAIPFTRFKKDMGHKPGKIAAGRYPEKATKAIVRLLSAVEANAQNKGLDTENVVIKSIIANRGSRPFRMGRRRRIKAKRTNIAIILEEVEQKKTQQKVKQPEKQVTPQKEEKKEPAPTVKKETKAPEKKEKKKK